MLAITRLLFLGGIRLSGLPASLAETSSTPICPSTPGGRPFQRFHLTHSARQLSMPHLHVPDGRFVSAPLPGLSPCALAGAPVLLVGGVSSSLDGSKAARQLASPNRYNCVSSQYAFSILTASLLVLFVLKFSFQRFYFF